MTDRLTDAKLQKLRDFFEGEQIMASNAVVRGNAVAARSVCDELIARRAADAPPAPGVDAVLLRESRDVRAPAFRDDSAIRAEIVAFVRDYRAKNGGGPSMREVLAASRLTGMNAVASHVDALLVRGKLDCRRHDDGKMIGRSLEVYGE